MRLRRDYDDVQCFFANVRLGAGNVTGGRAVRGRRSSAAAATAAKLLLALKGGAAVAGRPREKPRGERALSRVVARCERLNVGGRGRAGGSGCDWGCAGGTEAVPPGNVHTSAMPATIGGGDVRHSGLKSAAPPAGVEELLEPVEAVVELPPATVIAPGPGPGPGAARDALRALGPPKLKLRTAAPPIDRANAARLLPVRLPPRVIIISGVGTRSERGCLLLLLLPKRPRL